jgi:coenzyme F420-reducing hydrogenase beta subunit
MKSARLVESFAWQMNTGIEAVERPEYRLKGPERPANWYTAQLTLRDGSVREKDWWHLGDGDWGAGFFQNSACNFCDDVLAETADISFGDAWVEPYSSDWRGTNVVVVRSPVLRDLVAKGIEEQRLELGAVDADYIANTQAAGFRQRREGLAYRLTWHRPGLTPRKRVAPSNALPLQRKLIYRLRYGISWWSHHMFRLARQRRAPAIYITWAHAALRVYHGLAYGRGRVGAVARRLRLTRGEG